MPPVRIDIVHRHEGCPASRPWAVVGAETGKVHGCHPTKAAARRQQSAIYADVARRQKSSAGGSTVETLERTHNVSYDGPTVDVNPGSLTTAGGNEFLGAAVVDDEQAEDPTRKEWEGVLALVGHPTSDRRYLIPNEIGNRDLPLPFLVQPETASGHEGSQVAGRIEKIQMIPIDQFDRADEFGLKDITDNATVVFAEGTLDGSPAAEEAQRLIENGAGVSIDLPPERIAPFNKDTLEEVDPEDVTFEDMVMGTYLTGIAGKIAATTIVTIPAFEEASVMLRDANVLVASAGMIRIREATITASAAGMAPLKPPSEWFYMEEPSEPTPLTVTKDGRVYGHLALWDQCHTAISICERAPRSATNYSYFHTGQIETAEGELLNVGRITVGKEGSARGGHASIVLGRQGAMEHYEKTGSVGGFVRAKDGVLGIWLCGAVKSDAPAERIRDMRANVPSGDWRDYELVAVLSVTCGGFPVPRAEAALVASGADETVPVLIATGYHLDRVDRLTYRRQIRKLSARLAELTAIDEETEAEPFYWEEGGSGWERFKDYPAAERRKMAKDGRAMPDGSYPIKDCQDLMDAKRSVGRTAPGKRPAVRAHIAKREKAMSC